MPTDRWRRVTGKDEIDRVNSLQFGDLRVQEIELTPQVHIALPDSRLADTLHGPYTCRAAGLGECCMSPTPSSLARPAKALANGIGSTERLDAMEINGRTFSLTLV